MEKFPYYKKREETLLKIKGNIQKILDNYSEQASKIEGNWTDEDRERFKDWNDYHDKMYRVDSLLKVNLFAYQYYFYDNNGWLSIPTQED